MKKIIPAILLMFALSSCNGWVFQPLPYTPPTPFLPATMTPAIFTATPVVIGAASATLQIATSTNVQPPTNLPNLLPSATAINAPTNAAAQASVSVEVLGCDTSIDVTHSMGEVTNAYIVLKNSGNVHLTNLKATLFALDEGREHPDKTVEITVLPLGYQVTLKLTVDSTYQEETPIQIEVSGDGGLFQRVGAPSCLDIGLFAPNPNGLSTPIPINP